MSKAPPTIHVDPDSERARALADADSEPIILESNGKKYRVIHAADDLWADDDPERLLAKAREAAGTLTQEEGERLKALIYLSREEGTRPVGDAAQLPNT